MSEWRVVALAAIVWVIGCNDFTCPEPAVSGPGTTCVCPEGMLWTGTGCGLDPDAGTDTGMADAGTDAPDAAPDAMSDTMGDGAMCTLGTVTDCASCGDVCAFDNATPSCEMGGCAIGECDEGFDDCNERTSDGCEAELASGRENCGECGVMCETGLSCVEGICQDPVIDLCLSGAHGCTAHASGRVACWGDNNFEQLGRSGPPSDTPLWVAGVEDATKVACGFGFSCAVVRGSVWCWGDDFRGGTTTPSSVSGTVNPRQIDAGNQHVCITNLSDEVSCWGWNRQGQLGRGETSMREPEALRIDGFDAVAVTAGVHSCAARADGTAWCWGPNGRRELAAPSGVSFSSDPIQIGLLSGVTAVESGFFFTCALSAGEVYCWGANTSGVLGDVSLLEGEIVPVPRRVPSLREVNHIQVGRSHVCVLREGEVWCWGDNREGQTFGGVVDEQTTVREVGVSGVQVAVADGGTCVRQSDGRVLCFGSNSDGRLGLGSDEGPLHPTVLRFPE